MKKLFAIALLASFTAFAAPFKWVCDWPEARSQTFSLYQGETATFEPTFRVNGLVVSNATIEAVWYQTNGMGNAWWKLDDNTFTPSNDVGAAAYRFFVEAHADGEDILYRANGALRMLPSPGFTPNVISFPARALDFSVIDYTNAPWLLVDATNNFITAELDPTVPAWAKYIEPPLPPDYANVSNKAYTALQSFTEADPTVPAWAKSETQPLPPDYANVSNKAHTALQSFTETDPTISSWAKAAQKPSYSYSEITGKPTLATVATSGSYDDLSSKPTIPTVPTNVSAFNNDAGYLTSYTETDPTISSWAKAAQKPTYTASEVGAATAADVYRLIAGTNVVLVVTNYNSQTHAPAMKLQHLDPDSGQYITYWDETRRHGMTLTNAMNYTDAQIETRAPRAWSGTTSGLGAEAPAGVTWISTPETVIAGGYEYEKVVTSAGAVWVLTSNGLSTGATTNSFFRVSASDGTELFSIEKTDSYLVGVSADGITRSGNTVTVPVNVVGNAHPYIRATTNLVDAVWVKEDENGFSCPWCTVSWSGTTGAYVATITCSQPAAFFYFEYMVEGVAKIKNSAKIELTDEVIFNGTTYMPTVNGNKLEFVHQ